MNSFVFHGEVKQGRLKFDHPDKYLVYLASMEGKRIELTLQKERHNRSLSQNSYYWGVVIEILAEYFGYTPEEQHESLKWLFLKTHEDSLVTVKSTAKLSTIEFADYVDKVMRWAAMEYQIYIPDPGECVL